MNLVKKYPMWASGFFIYTATIHLAREICFLWKIIPVFPLFSLPGIFALGICPQHSKRFLRALTKEKLLEAKRSGPRLCIDLSMTHHMSKKVEHSLSPEFPLTWGRPRRCSCHKEYDQLQLPWSFINPVLGLLHWAAEFQDGWNEEDGKRVDILWFCLLCDLGHSVHGVPSLNGAFQNQVSKAPNLWPSPGKRNICRVACCGKSFFFLILITIFFYYIFVWKAKT